MSAGRRDDVVLPTLRTDCRHYRGDRPCAAGVDDVCPRDCADYAALGTRILVIKLGALGDVIRTAALLPGLKARWPVSEITWLTRPAGVRMLRNHPMIDRLLPLDAERVAHLTCERFDVCICLDKEPGPAGLAMQVRSGRRLGIGLSPEGRPIPLNAACGHYFRLGLSNALKFHGNRRSYVELIYDAVGLPFQRQRYRLFPGAPERAAAAAVWRAAGIVPRDVVIGLNTGAGAAFANKNWPAARYVELARQLTAATPWRVALFGGPAEAGRNAAIARAVPGVIDTGTTHEELTFAALLARCDALVTGDTMGLHAAIAGDVPAIALFGPTCPSEIDLYELGEHLVTTLTCGPCYRRQCDLSPNCMDAIPVERVLAAVQRWAGRRSKGTPHSVAAVRLPLLEAVR